MSAGRDDGGHILQAFMVDRLPGENLTVGASVDESAAMPKGTNIVYLCSDADCYITRGPSGIALTSSNGQFLPAGAILPYPIENGVLSIPDRPGYGVELIDDLEERFPFAPGPYYRANPLFEGRNLPIWWS